MPAFINQYIQEVTAKRERFRDCFRKEPRNDAEEALRDALQRAWLPLPDGPPPERRPTFAVDGASGQRPLSNGASLLVAQSLLAGPATEESLVSVEVVRGGDVRNAERMVDHLRQYCEAFVAFSHLDRLAGGMLLIDGSLLADAAHILSLGPLRMPGGWDLRAALRNAFLGLLEGCCARDILLVGVSKTTRDLLLHNSLLDDAPPEARLCDAEILHRFGGGAPGYTAPILFGTDAVQVAWADGDEALKERASALPCIAVFFLRLDGGEDALRVDVAGTSIGCRERLLAFDRKWADAAAVEPLVRRLMAQHGGPIVYNAPLYGVDRMVRLGGRTMDGAYMALLSEAAGAPISLDRSSRRFSK